MLDLETRLKVDVQPLEVDKATGLGLDDADVLAQLAHLLGHDALVQGRVGGRGCGRVRGGGGDGCAHCSGVGFDDIAVVDVGRR